VKTIIAGSRGITDIKIVEQAIKDSGFEITEVVCGMARGVDLLGKRWADSNDIPVAKFPANWEDFGRKAGYMRNAEMAAYAEALIAIWDGESRGTAHMIGKASSKGLKIYVHTQE